MLDSFNYGLQCLKKIDYSRENGHSSCDTISIARERKEAGCSNLKDNWVNYISVSQKVLIEL